jgi:eukaryotic-like serine/threonine-protein kinase
MSNHGAPTSAPAPISTRVQPGDVIAEKYTVERVLAEGGMGVVVAAQHRQLRRRVALKFLLPELCQMREVVERFLREAQAMTSIQNEHVARVLDVGTTTEGAPFMVMEYLEGEDLGQTLERRERLPPEEAIDYVLQGMEALAEAHVHGFVHRDLKPSNLFIAQRPDGSPLVKVLDFGISKVVANEGGGVDLTHASGLLGSPLYMSPEQIRSSRTVDARADIWTLGIIIHELIIGRPPFEAESVPAVLAAIIADDPPSIKSIREDVPEGLSEVVLRCLKRNRDERYASVAELATQLRPYASREGQLSIERIERVINHHVQRTTPVDLEVRTPAKGTPVPGKTPVTAPPFSPLGATAADPNVARDESTFGKYKLIAVLGQGGMADVFLAVLAGPEGLGFNKLVVIKRLRSNLASDPEFVSMLVDEARIAAKLNHPNVIQTYEVGVIANEYYIAMEYLDGQPLNRVIQRLRNGGQPVDSFPLAFRLGIVRDMLAGIHHAHGLVDFDGTALGLVHRDVTPQNTFVTYEGQVKVVDFGIAKARGRATETQQGILKGKVAYMAPEQANAKDVDRRADVFGAGVVLWELLTGERLWKGLDDVQIIQKLLLDKIPASPRAVSPEIPKALDAIVKRALSKKPGDRFETAEQFQLEIERFMESERLKCSPRQLGEWVGTLFADRRKQTRSLIEAQLSALRNAPRSVRSVDLRESGSSGSSGTPPSLRLERLDQEPVPESQLSRPDAAMARSHPGHGSGTWPIRGKSRWALVFGAALAMITVTIGLIARPTRTKVGITPTIVSSELTSPIPSGEPTASSSAPAVTASAPPAAPGQVRLALGGHPSSTEFVIDDEPKTRGPVSTSRLRDDKAHRITASAPGFRPETKTFTFDQDVSWNVQLVPVHGASPPPASAKATIPATTPSAAPPVAPQPTPATSSSGRKKRELDPDNPYAGQN